MVRSDKCIFMYLPFTQLRNTHGSGRFAVVWRSAVFIGHFKKQQIGQLFQIIAITDADVARGIAEGPDFADNAGGAAHKLNHFG